MVKSSVLVGVALAVATLIGCGKDNGEVTANVPQANCLENNGYGCSWEHYPQGWSQYPKSNDGYYSGYSHNNNGCAMGSHPIFKPDGGVVCAPINNPQDFYQQPWDRGRSYLYHCNVLQPYCPNGGACIPMHTMNMQGARQMGVHSEYSQWGVCGR